MDNKTEYRDLNMTPRDTRAANGGVLSVPPNAFSPLALA